MFQSFAKRKGFPLKSLMLLVQITSILNISFQDLSSFRKIFFLPQYSKKAFSFYKHYLSSKKQVKWRSSLLFSKRSCQPNTAAWYFYLFFKAFQAAILPSGFSQKAVMHFAVPSSVVTAAISVL
jgi:hypothetical protein